LRPQSVTPMKQPVKVASRPLGRFFVEAEVYKTDAGYISLGRVKKADSRTYIGFARSIDQTRPVVATRRHCWALRVTSGLERRRWNTGNLRKDPAKTC